MKNHRIWTTIFTYCRNIPIDQTLIDKVKALIKEDKNVFNHDEKRRSKN